MAGSDQGKGAMNDNIAEQALRHRLQRGTKWTTRVAATLMTMAFLVGCSDPADSNRGNSSGAAGAPEQCAPGNAFEPLRAPRAELDSGSTLTCVLCTVTNSRAVVDEDPSNSALLNVPVGLAGTAWVSVFDTARTHPPDSRIAFFIAGEEDAIPATIALNQQVTVTTFLNGEEQESSASDRGQVPLGVSLFDLPTLLITPTNPGPRSIVTQVTKEFDEVRLDFGGGLQVLNALRVFEVCVNSGG